MIVTIDGLSASGKSTVARRVAQQKHLFYLYSGLLFRGLGYLLHLYDGYTPETIVDVKRKNIDVLLDVNNPDHFVYEYTNADPRIFSRGCDITPSLKTPLVDELSSRIGIHEYVRARLEQIQRMIVHNALQKKEYMGVIVDGRDSGSIVFKKARYKFYLTASLAIRAQRICKAMVGSDTISCERIQQQRIQERDERDKQRDIAPLIIPKDAIVIDTSNMTIHEVVTAICRKIA